MGKKEQDGPMVSLDDNGRLVYQTTKRDERLLDYSHCGYLGGGVALPEADVKVTLEPSGDGETCSDDTARIQAAIDSLGSNDPLTSKDVNGGALSAILLKAGTYYIAGELQIAKSGIILRGEGDETVVIAAGNVKRNLIDIGGGGPGPIYKRDGTFDITQDRVHLGENTIECNHNGVLQVGDTVYVQRNTNVSPTGCNTTWVFFSLISHNTTAYQYYR